MGTLFGALAQRIPTEPQVRVLMQAFPELVPDEVIEYEKIEALLNLKREDSRFRSVTDAWRSRLSRELNYRVVAVHGRGFSRVNEVERSSLNTKEWVSKQRSAMRRVNDLQRVDSTGFSHAELSAHTHRTNVLTRVTHAVRQAGREIAPPKPSESLPRTARSGSGSDDGDSGA